MTSPLPTRPDEEWPAQAADSIVRLVDGVKQKTTVPAKTVAKGLKYGPAVAAFASVILVLLVIGLFRLGERILIFFGLSQPMWIVYTTTGVAFTGIGMYLWRKARI